MKRLLLICLLLAIPLIANGETIKIGDPVEQGDATIYTKTLEDNDDGTLAINDSLSVTGSVTATGNVSGATFGNDSSISNAELLTIDGGLTTQIARGDGGAGTGIVWTSDIPTEVTIGSGYIYRAGGTDVPVTDGGTGLSTLTDHSILLGSGTAAITPLGAATNGQLPIGSTGADPVLANITETGSALTVTNGAGTINLSAHAALESIVGLTEVDASILQCTADNTYAVLTSGGNNYILGSNSDNTALEFKTPANLLTQIDAELAAIAALATTDGNIIVGNDSTWVAENGATARASLGLTIGTNVLAPDGSAASLTGFPTLNQNTTGSSGSCTGNSITATSLYGITETNGGIPYGTADNTYAWLAAGDQGTLLMGNGAGAPSWLAAGTSGYMLVAAGASDPVWTSPTGTGAPVKETSPTLVTPDLGTPSVLVGTNISGTAASLTAGAVTNGVYTSRTISTTSPLTGGGDLSANRTLAIPAATSSANGYMTSTYATKVDGIADGADITGVTAGTGISGGGTSGTVTITNSAPHVATDITWTAGTIAGPVCNSSTGSDAAIPVASSTASGVVNTTTQTFDGAKTFSSTITGNISGSAGSGDYATSFFSSGTLEVSIGGTGLSSFDANYLYKGNTTSALAVSRIIDNGSNVGIGIANPSVDLHIYSSGNCDVAVDSVEAQNVGYAHYKAGELKWYAYVPASSDDLRFLANSVSRVTFKADGKVGIGTTSPTQELHVVGSIYASGGIQSDGAYADYVFDDDYALPDLDELNDFISENKHLPGMTINKGGTISHNQAIHELLVKVEEQSRYIIELHDRLKKLEEGK